jgi:hypothetical protein
MTATGTGEDAQEPEPTKMKRGLTGFLNRPIFWTLALVVAGFAGGFGGAIEDVIRPEAADIINDATERGDLVLV